ncbi:Uncharacterised protein [Mycobacteroides abscessus subsp. abscessus]|nr:Uncharacterised protein [Mycobacteroides abscessus subsp. abscessus]
MRGFLPARWSVSRCPAARRWRRRPRHHTCARGRRPALASDPLPAGVVRPRRRGGAFPPCRVQPVPNTPRHPARDSEANPGQRREACRGAAGIRPSGVPPRDCAPESACRPPPPRSCRAHVRRRGRRPRRSVPAHRAAIPHPNSGRPVSSGVPTPARHHWRAGPLPLASATLSNRPRRGAARTACTAVRTQRWAAWPEDVRAVPATNGRLRAASRAG